MRPIHQPIGTGVLLWRLFDFGKVDAEVGEARGASAEALAEHRQSVLRAARDVEDALVELSQSEVRVLQLEDEVAAVTRSCVLSERAYQAGCITLTDVLDATSATSRVPAVPSSNTQRRIMHLSCATTWALIFRLSREISIRASIDDAYPIGVSQRREEEHLAPIGIDLCICG